MNAVRRPLRLVALCGLTAAAAAAHAAPTIFAGLDNTFSIGSLSHPNTDAAATAFASAAGALVVQDFEGLALGVQPASFAAPLGGLQATFTNSATNFVSIADSSPFDTFAVSGSRYLDALSGAGSTYYSVAFSAPVSAFGFYVTDASDWVGTPPIVENLRIDIVQASGTTTVNLFEGISPTDIVNGNLGFFGAVDAADPILGFAIANPGGNPGEDALGIDDLAVHAVPLPPAVGLLAAALGALTVRRRRVG